MHILISMVSLTEAPMIGAFGAGAVLLFAVGLGAFFRALRRVEQQNQALDRVQMALGETRLGDAAAVHLAQKRLFLLVVDEGDAADPPAREEDCAGRLAEVLGQRERAQAGKPLGIVEFRLLMICAATQSRHVVPMMPALEDLEQMTREYELSHGALPVLRGVTNVLLMCGICGTLWGVSAQLGSTGGFEVDTLVPCLYPSLVAVVGFIVLNLALGGLLGRFERMVKQLDELTLRFFVPLFQPPPMVVQHRELFCKAILPLSSPQLVEQFRAVNQNGIDAFLKLSRCLQHLQFECWKVGAALAKRLQAAVLRREALEKRGRQLVEQQRTMAQLVERRVTWASKLRLALEECQKRASSLVLLSRQSGVWANKEVGATLRESVKVAKQLTSASKPSGVFYKRMRAMLSPYGKIMLKWSRLWTRLTAKGEEAAAASGVLHPLTNKLISCAQGIRALLQKAAQAMMERQGQEDFGGHIQELHMLLRELYELQTSIANMYQEWRNALQSCKQQFLDKRAAKKSSRVVFWLVLTAAAGIAVGVIHSVAAPPRPEPPTFADEADSFFSTDK